MDREFTPEYRLKLIAAILTKSEGLIGYYNAERIIYLCNRPDTWLSENRSNFKDVIDFLESRSSTHSNGAANDAAR